MSKKLALKELEHQFWMAAHIGAMDICARGLKAVAALIEDGGLEKALVERYAGWSDPAAKAMLDSTLDAITERVLAENLNPEPRSGQQEILENYVNRFV